MKGAIGETANAQKILKEIEARITFTVGAIAIVLTLGLHSSLI